MPALSQEAIRLTRWLHRLLPDDGEVAGLLALMLLTDARRPARTRPDGSLVPLAEQDRQQWDQAQIAEGIALISAALPRGEVGPYQLQAAIAAVHDEAKTMADTDWPQILGLYDLLERTAPNPFTALNRAVAVAMVHGPDAGLEVIATLAADKRMARHHRLLATRAHLHELAGRRRRGGRRLPRRGPARDQPARTPLPGASGREADGGRSEYDSAAPLGNGASVRSRWLNPWGARAWRRPEVWTLMSLAWTTAQPASVAAASSAWSSAVRSGLNPPAAR